MKPKRERIADMLEDYVNIGGCTEEEAKPFIEWLRGHKYERPIFDINDEVKAGIEETLERVSIASGVTIDQMKSFNRKREIVTARMLCFYFIREEFTNHCTFEYIGQILDRHHSTAIYGYKVINNLLKIKDPYLARLVENYDKLCESEKQIAA